MLIDDTVFYIQAMVRFKILNLKKCSSLDFEGTVNKDSLQWNFENMLCFSENVKIKPNEVISIVVNKCDSKGEALNNVTCSDEWDSKIIIYNSVLVLLYIDQIVGSEV